MAHIIYNRFFANLMNKVVDLEADTLNIAIVKNTYTPNKDHNVWADVSANEVSGAGYDAGGKALSGKAVLQDDANDMATFDVTDPVWTSVTFTDGRYGIIYDVSASNNLICCIDFGADKNPSGDDTFTIQVNASGVLKLYQP